VRTALVALIAFMPTNPNGALGSLDYNKEERRKLAIKSRNVAPRFGNTERQKLIDEIHEYMLSKAPPVPEPTPSEGKVPTTNREGEVEASAATSEGAAGDSSAVGEGNLQQVNETPANVNPNSTGVQARREVPAGVQADRMSQRTVTRVQTPADDRMFTWAAVGLTIAIVVLLLKKFMKSSGNVSVMMDWS